MSLQLDQFDYKLPEAQIARYPLPQRSDSRLLWLQQKSSQNHLKPQPSALLSHHYFHELPDLLPSHSLLVLNDTRVMRARLFAHKQSGGQVECFIEHILDEQRAQAMIRSNKPLKCPCLLEINGKPMLEIVEKQDDRFQVVCKSSLSMFELLSQFGTIPLPPYLKRATEPLDQIRYQTIYASQIGAVAAPTAGLHFDDNVFKRLKKRGIEIAFVTLHVGAGTFMPIRSNDINQHHMHSEYAMLSAEVCQTIKTAKQKNKRIIAVGTTTLRCLESAAQSGDLQPFHGETALFIKPGYTFRCVDGLITNFHLPKSTLLILACAFADYRPIMQAYDIAIKKGYRFYSYGDSMLIL